MEWESERQMITAVFYAEAVISNKTSGQEFNKKFKMWWKKNSKMSERKMWNLFSGCRLARFEKQLKSGACWIVSKFVRYL